MKQLYFIAIVLPSPILEKVEELKCDIYENYGCKVALKSPAHITIIPPFGIASSYEEKIKIILKQFSEKQNEFKIALNGFNKFNERTIFIDIKKSKPLETLYYSCNETFKNLSNKKLEHFFHPHITIANRDIPSNLFHEIWNKYQHTKFEEEFTCKNLTLLKNNGENWNVINIV